MRIKNATGDLINKQRTPSYLEAEEFVKFCNERGIKINLSDLEYYRQQGIFYPAFRIRNEDKPIYAWETSSEAIQYYKEQDKLVYVYDDKPSKDYYGYWQIYELKWMLRWLEMDMMSAHQSFRAAYEPKPIDGCDENIDIHSVTKSLRNSAQKHYKLYKRMMQLDPDFVPPLPMPTGMTLRDLELLRLDPNFMLPIDLEIFPKIPEFGRGIIANEGGKFRFFFEPLVELREEKEWLEIKENKDTPQEDLDRKFMDCVLKNLSKSPTWKNWIRPNGYGKEEFDRDRKKFPELNEIGCKCEKEIISPSVADKIKAKIKRKKIVTPKMLAGIEIFPSIEETEEFRDKMFLEWKLLIENEPHYLTLEKELYRDINDLGWYFVKLRGEEPVDLEKKYKGVATRRCPICQKPFVPKVANQKCCDKECRRKAKLLRERARRKKVDSGLYISMYQRGLVKI